MRFHDIAFWLSAFFILGIGLASLNVSIWIMVFAFAVFAVGNFYLKEKWVWFLLGVSILPGFFYYHFFSEYRIQNIPIGDNLIVRGVVTSNPSIGIENQQLFLNLDEPFGGEVLLYARPYPEFRYGDLLEVEGRLVESESAKAGALMFPKRVDFISSGNGNSFKEGLFYIKNKLVLNLQKVLPIEKSSLASGILLGERGEFGESFKDAMKKSGTTHIVALSGYNISIVAIMVSSLTAYFISRRRSFYVSIFVIVSFVLMTGAESSVVRAAIMGIIALAAEQNSRAHSMRNAITLTAAAMLAFNPKLLVFDVAFQLSFLALMGIIYLEPFIKRRFGIVKNEKWKIGWRKNLLQTTSAQIAVLPIVIWTFGYFSPLSIIANLLILEFVPITMLLAFVVAISGFLFYPLSLVLGWLAGIFLSYEIFIINLFSLNWL